MIIIIIMMMLQLTCLNLLRHPDAPKWLGHFLLRITPWHRLVSGPGGTCEWSFWGQRALNFGFAVWCVGSIGLPPWQRVVFIWGWCIFGWHWFWGQQSIWRNYPPNLPTIQPNPWDNWIGLSLQSPSQCLGRMIHASRKKTPRCWAIHHIFVRSRDTVFWTSQPVYPCASIAIEVVRVENAKLHRCRYSSRSG